jgi:hypothetical protein
MSGSKEPSADSVKREFVDDGERTLGWDDESLRRQQDAKRRKQAEATREVEKRGILESLRAWFQLVILAVTGGQDLEAGSLSHRIPVYLGLVLALILVAVLVFMGIDRMNRDAGG